MYTLEYSGDNIYTGDISNTSDIKGVTTTNFDYNFSTDKSIVSDSVCSTANVCFYKNKGNNIFPIGKYSRKNIVFSNKTFYQNSALDHTLTAVLGYTSTSYFLGSSNILLEFSGNFGIKISYIDTYNVVFSFWIYLVGDILYIKNNGNIIYTYTIFDNILNFNLHNNNLIINSKSVMTVAGDFLPYTFFIYGNVIDINIFSKYCMPIALEGSGEVIDDIYGDTYCLSKPQTGISYLRSKADNILTSCSGFIFDMACRAVGNSIPFSISAGGSFNGTHFVMDSPKVWVEFDVINSIFYSNILTSSGITTVSGVLSELNNYYLLRCYYKDGNFGTILNGIDTYTVCDNVTSSGGTLNILTYNTLMIDSFALYEDVFPTAETYNESLNKLVAAVSSVSLVDSHNSSTLLFGVDNFYPKDANYAGSYCGVGDIPISNSSFTYYTSYSLAGGEAILNSDNFYVSRLPFDESSYACFPCKNNKTFLTYFSGINVPVKRVVAESFTNYNYITDNFITTNSGLYIRNYSKVFNSIAPASIIEFSDIGWTDSLNIGVLFKTSDIPIYPNSHCAVVTSAGNLYIGMTTVTGLNITDNSSIYFYLDDSVVVISGSTTGILGSASVVSSYNYLHYFVKSSDSIFASINKIYVSTALKEINTLTNKFFSYELPVCYKLDTSYTELFYNISSNSSISSEGIILYDYDFREHQGSFSSYYDVTFSGIFNISGYSFLGITDDFKGGFIPERWRLICDPYGVHSCTQPGWVPIDTGDCSNCSSEQDLYDDDIVTPVHPLGYTVSSGEFYSVYFDNNACLVDTVSMYVTSEQDPGYGFTVLCDVDYYTGSAWEPLLNNYIFSTLSGVSWPICCNIPVPIGRYYGIRVIANSNWDLVVPTELHPACYYNYGGTAVCTVSGSTCVHVALEDELHIYSEYTLEDSFNLSFSGINYYPCNFKVLLQDYSGSNCYIKTDWINYSSCDITVSSGISTTISGLFGSINYNFYINRGLDAIDLSAAAAGKEVYNNYSFSSDSLGLDLIFYNKDIPHVVGSGCLFGFEAENYTVSFSSIAAGYKFNALDGTNNISKAGVSFSTYPPNLFVNKVVGSNIEQSYMPCNELTSSGFQLVANIVDNNISAEVGMKKVGGVQQVSKFNRVDLFSDYVLVPTVLYKSYVVGENQKYTSFSDVVSILQTGDKVYFYPGSYTINTDKQITIIGIGNPVEVQLEIESATAGLTVMGCTTTKCNGSGVFNMYNCYILPWVGPVVILYNVEFINFYNCTLYNYGRMSWSSSCVLLSKCSMYKSSFSGNIIISDESCYSSRGHYGYGPEFNRASIVSGLSHVDSITVSSFYHNARYNQFPLHSQVPVGKDSCNQLISSNNSYSVHFYGDIKKLNSFSMYLFIQDLNGKIEIKNSSDFNFIVNSNSLDVGIHLVMSVYGLEVDMPVSISHSNVFKIAMVAVIFDGGSISIYLNGAKLATKYIVVVDFNDISSYQDDSILFFDDTKFICEGDGLLLKGAALKERIDFLVGTHVEELDSDKVTTIKVNMEFSTCPVLSSYHDNSDNYYGYIAYNTGVGIYRTSPLADQEHIYFNASKEYKIQQNIATKYLGKYKRMNSSSCISDFEDDYVAPLERDSITFSAAKIDSYDLGYCNILNPQGYIALDLKLPVPVISRNSYCFDISSSVVMLSFDLPYVTEHPEHSYIHDVGPNSLICSIHEEYHDFLCSNFGIFHKSTTYGGGSCSYVDYNSVLNLTNNFTIELLFSHYSGNGFEGYLFTKGTVACNIAYCVGITTGGVPYFKWSWDGDNVVYAEKSIQIDDVTYLVVVVGVNTISFYINGHSAGVAYTNKLVIIDNSEKLTIAHGQRGQTSRKQVTFEEICLLNKVKTKEEIEDTWNTICGGEDAPWIKINSVVVVSDMPIKISPSDRFIEENKEIDKSKWEYTSYKNPVAENGLIVDSRLTKKIKSKVISYNVIFDTSIFCEFLEYSTNRNWSIIFKYKFASNNYISIIVNYVKYDGLYVKCEYCYNDYKNSTDLIKFVLSPCGIRFFTDYEGYTYVQIGNYTFWSTLWTSPKNLFIETGGWLEVTTSNDDWDSWFVVKLTNFLPRLFCSSILNDDISDFYAAVPYGRSFYNQIPKNIMALTLSNDTFEVDSTSAGCDCIHSLEFVNGQLPSTYVLDLTDYVFDNVAFQTFNIELLVYLGYEDVAVLDLFPWINIDIKDKYVHITLRDSDRIIVDNIETILDNYVYIAISINKPHTTIRINDKKFVYDTNFAKPLPYHFYPVGKSFSGRVIYFCGYYGDFDLSGYNFRVATLARYVGFDCCGRKVFGNNIVTSLDTSSMIYAYDFPVYSVLLKSKSCSLVYDASSSVEILFDTAVLSSLVSVAIIIKCWYASQPDKIVDIVVSAYEYNVSHNYYGFFGCIGEGNLLFDYSLVGASNIDNNTSIFYLDVTKKVLEKILKGTVVLYVKNKETTIINNISVYLDGQLSINDFYNSSLLV